MAVTMAGCVSGSKTEFQDQPQISVSSIETVETTSVPKTNINNNNGNGEGKCNIPEVDGKDGKGNGAPSVTISEKGTWIVDGIDTEIPVTDKHDKDKVNNNEGKCNIPEVDGKDGKEGKCNIPLIGYDDYSEPEKEPSVDYIIPEISQNGTWIINGEDTQIHVIDEDGNSVKPEIGENGNWYLNGKDTEKPVTDKHDKDKANNNEGKCNIPLIGYDDYSEPEQVTSFDYIIPEISQNGTWTINGEDTQIYVIGEDGNSVKPEIGENGNWYLNGKDTEKPVQKAPVAGEKQEK